MSLYNKTIKLAHDVPSLRPYLVPLLDKHHRRQAKVLGLKPILGQFQKASEEQFRAFALLEKRAAAVGLKYELDTRPLIQALGEGQKALKDFHKDVASLQKFARVAALLQKLAFTFTYEEALDFLGLSEGASDEDIIQARKNLQRKFHPDRVDSERETNPAQYQYYQDVYQKAGVAAEVALKGPEGDASKGYAGPDEPPHPDTQAWSDSRARADYEEFYRQYTQGTPSEKRRAQKIWENFKKRSRGEKVPYSYGAGDPVGDFAVEMVAMLAAFLGAVLIFVGIEKIKSYLNKPPKANPKTEVALMQDAFKRLLRLPEKYQKVLGRVRTVVDKAKGSEEGEELGRVYDKLDKHLKRSGPIDKAFTKIENEIKVLGLLAGK